MLSKRMKVVDKDALEEIIENALTYMEETGVSCRIRRPDICISKCIIFPLVKG